MKNTLSDLGRRPLLVATLAGNDRLLESAKLAARFGADLIEVRLDTFDAKENENISDLLLAIRDVSKLPLIGTVRSRKEGGGPSGTRSEKERRSLYEIILPLVDVVDVELNSRAINRQVVRLAHRRRKKVILSYHNFKSVPSEQVLSRLVQKFKRLRGDILKIAAMPKNENEVGRFLKYCSGLKKIHRTFIAMGKLGMISRIIGFYFGSCLTYGYIDKAAAPGQFSVRELADHLRVFDPAFRALKKI